MLKGRSGHMSCCDARHMIALLQGIWIVRLCSETRLQSVMFSAVQDRKCAQLVPWGEVETEKGFSHLEHKQGELIRAYLIV